MAWVVVVKDSEGVEIDRSPVMPGANSRDDAREFLEFQLGMEALVGASNGDASSRSKAVAADQVRTEKLDSVTVTTDAAGTEIYELLEV